MGMTIKNKCIASRGSLRRQSKQGSPLYPAFPDMKTLRVSSGLPESKASLENLQELSGKLPASLLRSGSRILRKASQL